MIRAILYGAKMKAAHKRSRIIPRVASKTRANNWDVRFGALAVSYCLKALYVKLFRNASDFPSLISALLICIFVTYDIFSALHTYWGLKHAQNMWWRHYPDNIYLSNRNTRKTWNMFKVNNKSTRTKWLRSFWCFYC